MNASATGADDPTLTAPSVVPGHRAWTWLSPDGEVIEAPAAALLPRLLAHPPLCLHARALGRRLGLERLPAYDLLELWAFVHPARFCLPTPAGLAQALHLPIPRDAASGAALLAEAATRLLEDLRLGRAHRGSDAAAIAAAMGRGGWRWTPSVLAALGGTPPPDRVRKGLAVWETLPEWSEEAPPPSPGHLPVLPHEARERLRQLVAAGPSRAEPRPAQAAYAAEASAAFAPRATPDGPTLVLAEAGTGTGKTLGYLAPATLWAERNGGAVWVATYTRNLQAQIDAELRRLFPDPETHARRVVIRKGRENYLCLLNLAEATHAGAQHAVGVGLMARWAAASRDGDLSGGDLPGWLPDMAGRGRTLGLADRRGECLHGACEHYHRCFVERSLRRARHADIVVANHALVLIQAALGAGEGEGRLPTRLVFDEGHHLFDAADSAFAAHLTGQESAELRRWLVGSETSRRRGLRGLRRRLEGLLEDEADWALVAAAEEAARLLPGEGWRDRVLGQGTPHGPAELFLQAVRTQTYARLSPGDRASPYALAIETRPVTEDVAAAAAGLARACAALARPLGALVRRLGERLDEDAELAGAAARGEAERAPLSSEERLRMEAAQRAIHRRARGELAAWQAALASLAEGPPPEFVDWFGIERIEGRDLDVGLYRHWVDPTRPLAELVLRPAHGVLITSATLSDPAPEDPSGWDSADLRSGVAHLPPDLPAILRTRHPSPFDYAAATRVLVVRDVPRRDPDALAAAYRELFLAAGGGALGLFTAVERLRAVRERIAARLEAAGLPLYAQHADGLDVQTLVEIFRAEEDSCLLGTDAVRDGVDVPGRALRLIVFDRTPWPRPDILHRARRARFGARRWDELTARLRLKQAFGRLVRREGDRGCFVLLDAGLPTRLATAFPPEVPIERVGLAEALTIVRRFVGPPE